MAAWVEIANRALGFVGNERMNSLDEATAAAAAINAHKDFVADAVLRAHPWNCATARAMLAADAQPPAFGFAASFQLPAYPYCLRVLALGSDAQPYTGAWQVEGRKILADAGGPLAIRYIARVGPEVWDALLCDAIAIRLAYAVAYLLTASRDSEGALWAQYERLIREARSIDGAEGSPTIGWRSALLEARN